MRSMVEGASLGRLGSLSSVNAMLWNFSDGGWSRPLHHFVVPLPRKRGRIEKTRRTVSHPARLGSACEADQPRAAISSGTTVL